jgi:hypothetical protein
MMTIMEKTQVFFRSESGDEALLENALLLAFLAGLILSALGLSGVSFQEMAQSMREVSNEAIRLLHP